MKSKFDHSFTNMDELDLSWKNLNKKTGRELSALLENIDSTITSLILRRNNLAAVNTQELATALSKTATSITLLDLSANNLGFKSAMDLTAILSVIPKHIISLHLDWNLFNKKTGSELATILSSLSSNLTNLSLRRNGLHNKTTDELANAFSKLPASLNFFDLSWNDLHHQKGKGLASIFSSFSKNIISLNFSMNGVDQLSLPDLQALKGKLPQLTTIYLSYKEVVKMSLIKRQTLAMIYPNIQNVYLLKPIQEKSNNSQDFLELNLIRSLGGKMEIPSLLSQCLFCVKELKLTGNLPEDLKQKLIL